MELKKIDIIIGIQIFLQTFQTASCGIICPWSKQTSQTVFSCPQNKEEMEARAILKNCTSKAYEQNCVEPTQIKYHCVMNELENTFIEVCAPEYRIHGYCTEYNEVGTVIQEHHNLRCENVKPPCNSSYLSTESYRFKGCYDIVRKNIQRSSTKQTTPVPSTPAEYLRFTISHANHGQCIQLIPLFYPLSLLYTLDCI